MEQGCGTMSATTTSYKLPVSYKFIYLQAVWSSIVVLLVSIATGVRRNCRNRRWQTENCVKLLLLEWSKNVCCENCRMWCIWLMELISGRYQYSISLLARYSCCRARASSTILISKQQLLYFMVVIIWRETSNKRVVCSPYHLDIGAGVKCGWADVPTCKMRV